MALLTCIEATRADRRCSPAPSIFCAAVPTGWSHRGSRIAVPHCSTPHSAPVQPPKPISPRQGDTPPAFSGSWDPAAMRPLLISLLLSCTVVSTAHGGSAHAGDAGRETSAGPTGRLPRPSCTARRCARPRTCGSSPRRTPGPAAQHHAVRRAGQIRLPSADPEDRLGSGLEARHRSMPGQPAVVSR